MKLSTGNDGDAASKAALICMTRSLAREVGEFGICVNAIAPGLVEHEGQNAPVGAIHESPLQADAGGSDGEHWYFSHPQDSDFMTGQAIVVDGGSIFH